MTDAREHALVFGCAGETLVGVLSLPELPGTTQDTGVVIVVGGPQVRAGSHRQFVQLARHVAAAGYPVLRFDVRGMGDSTGALRNFEAIGEDIGAAIGQLTERVPNLRRIVLWGLCDGASAALLYCQQTSDPRIAGLCLLNPWVRSEASLARTQVKHYYLQRVMQKSFWTKLLGGGIGGKALTGLFGNLRTAAASAGGGSSASLSYQQRMARGVTAFGGPIAVVLSGQDYTAKEFIDHAGTEPAWQRAFARPQVRRIDFAGADHTFSALPDQRELEAATLSWLRTSWKLAA